MASTSNRLKKLSKPTTLAMGKIKDLTIQIDDIIEDIYVLGDFYSPDTFAELVYKRMKEADINVA